MTGDAFGGDEFSDFISDIQPGSKVGSWVGKLRYRQGNDPRDWSSAGGSTYLPKDWQMQCGSFRDMFTARNSGGFEITFPVPFGEFHTGHFQAGPSIILSSCAPRPARCQASRRSRSCRQLSHLPRWSRFTGGQLIISPAYTLTGLPLDRSVCSNPICSGKYPLR